MKCSKKVTKKEFDSYKKKDEKRDKKLVKSEIRKAKLAKRK